MRGHFHLLFDNKSKNITCETCGMHFTELFCILNADHWNIIMEPYHIGHLITRCQMSRLRIKRSLNSFVISLNGDFSLSVRYTSFPVCYQTIFQFEWTFRDLDHHTLYPLHQDKLFYIIISLQGLYWLGITV